MRQSVKRLHNVIVLNISSSYVSSYERHKCILSPCSPQADGKRSENPGPFFPGWPPLFPPGLPVRMTFSFKNMYIDLFVQCNALFCLIFFL